MLRSKSFKSELYDTAGVEEKLIRKDQDMADMKRMVKQKVSGGAVPNFMDMCG